MSLKTTFAAVLKAMRATRGISQKKLAEVSSRTYISKLERGQCCPTLEMITALSVPRKVSPLTLMAITQGAQTGKPILGLVSQIEREVTELAESGMLQKLQISLGEEPRVYDRRSRPRATNSTVPTPQTEFCFAE